MRKIYEWKERQKLLREYSFLRNLQEATDKETYLQMLQKEEERLLAEIEMIEERERKEYAGEYDLSRPLVPVMYEDERILLRRPEPEDREPFLQVKRQYAFSKTMFQRENYPDDLWKEHISEESLYYSITGKKNDKYIGYCGVKNLKKKVWEVAIELDGKYCHQGYGFLALGKYLENLAELSGRREFASRVEADNIASQKLMEKLGFQPYGLAEFLLHSEEDKREAEEEYLYLLDERYEKLAERFQVEPRKLLSHVLEYRLCM
ncbi:MAG: GNAT family N-acetyltransferase [Lachnospiraceae bacterium]|nr:GNAT family N-acetyltransferase [Lachnospiraceae bacterium]